MNSSIRHSHATHARDETIASQVRGRLHRHLWRELPNIQVIVEGGVVQLLGEVSSFHQKQLATSCAQQTPGVEQTINRLNVPDDRYPSPAD